MESDPESSREAESEYKIGFLKKLTSKFIFYSITLILVKKSTKKY